MRLTTMRALMIHLSDSMNPRVRRFMTRRPTARVADMTNVKILVGSISAGRLGRRCHYW